MRRGREERATDRLRAAAAAQLTYAEVGATAAGALPAGYHHLARRRRVGNGDACFRTAIEHLMTWGMHRAAGLTVAATSARAEVGTVVLVGLGGGPVRLPAPCRVVDVVDDPGRYGFAYGTLPGHPERGEERFVVTLAPDGAVDVEITAFSRPATWWARLAGPVGRQVQSLVTDRYLASFVRAS